MILIKKLKVSNFKSFKDVEIEFRDFDVIIGANASGKSNLIQIFSFLRDIQTSGLNDAISLQGGIQFLRNVILGDSENISFEITMNAPDDRDTTYWHPIHRLKSIENYRIEYKPLELIYKFSLKTSKTGKSYKIEEDRATLRCTFFKHVRASVANRPSKRRREMPIKLGEGALILNNAKGRIKLEIVQPEGETLISPIRGENIYERINSKSLILELPYFFYNRFFNKSFRGIGIYDFDPKLPKRAIPITAKAQLEEDGSNLSIVLNHILEVRKDKVTFHNLMTDLLPFVDKLAVERLSDKSILFKLHEIYFKRQYLPSSFISDGTINISALIVALYFQSKRLTIIEEPERNIHPYLISKVVEMVREAAKKKQVIITTHNPEMIRNVSPEEILTVDRDNTGFSKVYRPSSIERVAEFMKNGMGVDELYVMDLLGL